MKRRHLAITFATLLGALASGTVAPRVAYAQGDNEAESYFREGRRLLDAGDLELACAKFAESQRLEPAAGTLLNLGDCFERRGMVASAFRAYKEASAAATLRARADWQQLAAERMAGLAGKIPMLVVRIPDASRVAGLVVHVDGRAIDLGARDPREQIDPGTHEVVASAPGFAPWKTSVEVRGNTPASVDVPRLLEAPRETPADTAATTSSGLGWQKVTGLVVSGVGIASLAFGGVAGIAAINGKEDAASKCPSYPDRCTAEGSETNDRAETWATLSTITFIAGGVLTAAGVTLFLTAPSEKTTAALVVGPDRVGVRTTF